MTNWQTLYDACFWFEKDTFLPSRLSNVHSIWPEIHLILPTVGIWIIIVHCPATYYLSSFPEKQLCVNLNELFALSEPDVLQDPPSRTSSSALV